MFLGSKEANQLTTPQKKIKKIKIGNIVYHRGKHFDECIVNWGVKYIKITFRKVIELKGEKELFYKDFHEFYCSRYTPVIAEWYEDKNI